MNNSFFYNLSRNVVKDEDAPAYFSRKALFFFSLFFGVLFSSVLFCLNLSSRPNKTPIFIVILFGVLFTAFQLFVLGALKPNTGLTFIFNSIGSTVLIWFFWNRYIGANVLYRAKPIWLPLICGVILMVFLAAFFLWALG